MLFTWTTTHVALVIGSVLSLLAIAQMLRQRRSPSSTAAWLLAIIAMPYLAVPLYLTFGGRKLRRRAAAKTGLGLVARGEIPLEMANHLDRTLRTYDIPGATDCNRMIVCPTGAEGLSALLALIDSAERSLHVETFILHADDVGREVIARLTRRASEGLGVRLLVDGFGSLWLPRREVQPLLDAGGQFAFFNPVVHIPFVRRTNLRNHRKITVADGRLAFAGGMNITANDMYRTAGRDAWQDLSFVVDGPAAWHFDQIFRQDWNFATGTEQKELGEPPAPERSSHQAQLQVVPAGPDAPNDPLVDAILMAIYTARQRILIVTPYFVPDDSITQALVIACHRGVKVQILVPERSNHLLADIARGSPLREIERAGGIIYRYRQGMVHAKLILVDDAVAMVGSANLDMRSLLLNFEVMMFVYSRTEIDSLDGWATRLIDGSSAGMPAAGAVWEYVEGLTRLVQSQL